MDRRSTHKEGKEDLLEWTKEQDSYLRSLLEMYGDSDWRIVADCMNNKFKELQRTGKDCRSHWKTYLDTNSFKQSWSERERYLLLIAHQKYKNRWSEVARMLHKQSSNLIKNRFYTLFRKIRNRVKNNDLVTTSSLDLLEIYYVLSLVEYYHSTMPEKPEPDYAEKNYAHKLVQQMDKKKVAEFKAKVMELHKEEGTMTELFEKYGKIYISAPKEEEDEKLKIEDEQECKQIELAENEEEVAIKIKIQLPTPNSFSSSLVMTAEEKDAFWRSAFLSKEPKSELISVKSSYETFSVKSSLQNQANSVGSMAMRDDEFVGFSQFATPFESEGKKSAAAPSYPNQLPPLSSSVLNPSTKPLDNTILTSQYGQQIQPVPSPSAPVMTALPSIRTSLIHSMNSPFQSTSMQPYQVPYDTAQGFQEFPQPNPIMGMHYQFWDHK